MLIFEKMRTEEQEECAFLAANAFFDYDYFTCYVSDKKKRMRFLRQLIKSELKTNENAALFFVAKEDRKIKAVAMLCPPDYIKPSDGAYIKNGYLKCYLYGGVKSVMQWGEMEKKAGAHCHEKKNAWYISLLTVSPTCQGEGVGSRIINECLLPYIKAHNGKTVTLFTNSEENRQFYIKNGFHQFHEQFFVQNGFRLGSWSFESEIDD